MKLLYPASNDIPQLTDAQLTLKIARHSPCSICDSCPGLHPPPAVEVVSDEGRITTSFGDLADFASDDEPAYLEICECGHSAGDHGADQSKIDREEFARRGRVAVRLDEQLQVCALVRFHCTGLNEIPTGVEF